MKRLFFLALLTLGFSVMLSSCDSNKGALEGYEWLEGKWVSDHTPGLYSSVIITPNYFQCTSELHDGEVITNVAKRPKQELKIEIYYNDMLQSDVKSFDIYHLDETRKEIYWLYDFDQKIYMRKI